MTKKKKDAEVDVTAYVLLAIYIISIAWLFFSTPAWCEKVAGTSFNSTTPAIATTYDKTCVEGERNMVFWVFKAAISPITFAFDIAWWVNSWTW